eukprot:7661961-Alexandrium_andersonii.AAC.1
MGIHCGGVPCFSSGSRFSGERPALAHWCVGPGAQCDHAEEAVLWWRFEIVDMWTRQLAPLL